MTIAMCCSLMRLKRLEMLRASRSRCVTVINRSLKATVPQDAH
jgi:hypothetical protein